MDLTFRESHDWYYKAYLGKLNVLKEKYASNKTYLNSLSHVDAGYTALHAVALTGNLEIIEWLISKKTNTNIKDPIGQTALHLVVRYGHSDAVEILLSNGANLEAKDKRQQTALHYASRFGRPEIVQYLLTEGASPNTRDQDGKTPREVAKKNEVREAFDSFLAGRE